MAGALIQNLIARLTMDSTDFDSGAKRSANSLKGIQAQSLSLQKGLVNLAATYLGARGLKNAIESVTAAASKHESAERKLYASLMLTGQATKTNVSAIQQFAAAIQKQTIYSDEEIVNQIAYAKAMGLSTAKIGEATIAAIGMAAAYDKDLSQAMRTVVLAAKGETGQLKEMGVVIDKNLTPQEKYNELIRQMTVRYQLANQATKTIAGTTAQLKNTWSDTKEVIGSALLPALNDLFTSLNRLLVENQGAVKRWASDFLEGTQIVKEALASISSGTDLNSRFENLSPSMQKSIQQAYESERGAQWGYHRGVVPSMGPGMMPYETQLAGFGDNESYANRLMSAYERQQIAKARARAGGLGAVPSPQGSGTNGVVAPTLSGMGTDGAFESEEWASQTRHFQTIGEGLTAWIKEAQDEMKTLGDLAYDLGKKLQSGVVDSLADAVVEGEDLEDMLRAVLKDLAKMALKQALNAATTAIGSALVGHSGGVIGSSAFAARRDASASWSLAPRLHDGLRPDEFRFIGQRGEKITSKSGVASENRLMGRMVTLLERMASRQSVANVQIVDKRQTPQEWFLSREGEKAWQYHAARNR